eukprot:7524310-Pyramimonas_sp.AAC.1
MMAFDAGSVSAAKTYSTCKPAFTAWMSASASRSVPRPEHMLPNRSGPSPKCLGIATPRVCTVMKCYSNDGDMMTDCGGAL